MIQDRWLVTGAAGFIGFHLCRYLLAANKSVVGFDNYFSGTRENVDRLEALNSGQFKMIEGDIRDTAAVRAAADECRVVVNLAGQVSVQKSLDDPLETHAINATGFISVHQAAGDAGAERLLYASTCAVYGDSQELPLNEAALPRPLSPYAASKLANEYDAAGLEVHAPQLVTTGFRFFNVFGAWQPVAGGYAAVIPLWVEACLTGQRPVMYGDGTTTRDFIYVDNLCRAIERAADPALRPAHAVYNLGTGVATRLDALFNTITDVIHAGGRDIPFDMPECQPWRPGDVLHSVSDVSRARKDLGFDPVVDLREGLARMLSEQYALSVQ